MQKDGAKTGSKPAKTVPEIFTGQGTLMPVGLGRVYGYARVSRSDSQDYGHQVSALRAAGAKKIFTDEISGGVPTGARPGFRDAVSHLRSGDVLVAAEMSRISRSLTDLIATIEMLTTQGVTVRVLGLGDLDSTSATGRLMIGLLGLVAEFERSLIRARTISGIANARRSGVRIGRPPALDAQGTRTLIAMKSAGASVPEVCVALSVSERTVRRTLAAHLPQPFTSTQPRRATSPTSSTIPAAKS